MTKSSKHFIILCLLLFIGVQMNAQYAPTYTAGWDPNFVAINQSVLSPTSGTTTFTNDQKLLSTIINISYKIHNRLMKLNNYNTMADGGAALTQANIDASPAYEYNRYIIANGLKIQKVMYAKNPISGSPDKYLRMIIARPNDNVVRPCLFITNGAGHLMCDMGQSFSIYAYMAEMALRGNVVVFWENYSNDFASIVKGLQSANYPYCYSHDIDPTVAHNKNGAQIIQDRTYAIYQLSVAAYNYLVTDAALPLANRKANVDVNNIFAFSISQGAFSSLQMAYSREGINYLQSNTFYDPNNTTVIIPNNSTKLCLNASPSSNIQLKGVIAGDGGLHRNNNSYFKTFGVIAPKNVATLLLYGANDKSVLYNGGGSAISNPASFIPFSGIRDSLKLNNTPNKLFVNCTGDHPFSRNGKNSLNQPQTNGIADMSTAADTAYSYSFANFNTAANPTNPNEFINSSNDIQTIYSNISYNGIFVRSFASQMSYGISQIINTNTIIAGFMKDIRTGNTSTYIPNNYATNNYYTPVNYIKTTNDYSYNLFTAQIDGHFDNSTPCTYYIDQTTQSGVFLRKKQDETINTKLSNLPLFYPNPSTGIVNLNIKLDNPINNYNILVYSVDGKTVYNQFISEKIEADNYLQKYIDLSSEANGVYFVRITTNDNNILFNKTVLLNK